MSKSSSSGSKEVLTLKQENAFLDTDLLIHTRRWTFLYQFILNDHFEEEGQGPWRSITFFFMARCKCGAIWWMLAKLFQRLTSLSYAFTGITLKKKVKVAKDWHSSLAISCWHIFYKININDPNDRARTRFFYNLTLMTYWLRVKLRTKLVSHMTKRETLKYMQCGSLT